MCRKIMLVLLTFVLTEHEIEKYYKGQHVHRCVTGHVPCVRHGI